MTVTIGEQLSTIAGETTMTLQELVSTMKASGMDNGAIKNVLLNDLKTGGRVFGRYRNQIKNTVKTGIGMSAGNASRTTFQNAGVKQFRWQSVGDTKVCEDCEPRQGQVDSLEFWQTVGLPQSGFSICRYNCRCQLVPANYTAKGLDKPLLRNKNITNFNMAGKHKSIKDSDKWLEKNLNLKYSSLKDISLENRNKLNRLFKKHIDNGAKFNYRSITATSLRGNTYAQANVKTLQINSKIFNKDKKYYNNLLNDDVKAGWHPRGCNSFESMMSHEMGHSLSLKDIDVKGTKRWKAIIKTDKGKKLNAVWNEYVTDMMKRKKEFLIKWESKGKTKQQFKDYIKSFKSKVKPHPTIPNKFVTNNTSADFYKEVYGDNFISKYANTNIQEFIAECYSMSYHTSNSSKYALKIRDLLNG